MKDPRTRPAKLLPPIGYRGGKRRLLPRLRPLFDPAEISVYAEPFLGMGALYLDLRARGFRGQAVLAEKHPDLRAVWELMHDPEKGRLLVEAARTLPAIPTPEYRDRIRAHPEPDPILRSAKWLWLVHTSFGGNPVRHSDAGWRCNGSRFNKHVPVPAWTPSVDRLEAAIDVIAGLPVEILSDADEALSRASSGWWVYADPPYAGTSGYQGGSVYDLEALKGAAQRGARVVLSESNDLRERLHGWEASSGKVTARVTHGKGAKGDRAEWIYTSPSETEVDVWIQGRRIA